MTSERHLLRRQGVYYVLVRVPARLMKALGRHELVRSLHTRLLTEAREQALPLLAGARRLFREVSVMPDLTIEEIQQLTRYHFHEVILPRHENWRLSTRDENRFEVMPSSAYEQHPLAPTVDDVVEKLVHPNGYRQGDFLFTMCREVLSQSGISLSENSPAFKELAVVGMKAIQEAMATMVSQYANHIPNPPIPCDWLRDGSRDDDMRAMRVSHLFTKYEEVNQSRYTYRHFCK